MTILLLIIILLAVSFFTSSETAFLSLPKLKVRSMVEEGRKNAKLIAKLKNNMDRLLTTVLIGTNFLNSLASALATALAISIFGKNGSAIATLLTAFFITIFGQIIPKTAAALYPDKFAQFSSIPLAILQKLIFPVAYLFEKLSHLVVGIAEKLIKNSDTIVTEEELKTLIDVGSQEGTIEKDENILLNKIIKFNNLQVKDVMKHRSFVSMIEESATYNEVVQEFLSSGFSTITVYKENAENVVGVINYKQILFGTQKNDNSKGYARRFMKEVLFVPGTFSVLELLQKFRKSTHKFAVVLDEQGQTDGIITMEDIINVVFGKMTDDYSFQNVAPEDKVKLISHDTFIVPGDIKIDDVNEMLGLQLKSDDMNTVGGWLLEQFGFLPQVSNVLVNGTNIFTVEEVIQRRITSIRIKKG